MVIDATTVDSVGKAIIGPLVGLAGSILAYLKINSERARTGEKRDAQSILLEKRVADLETKISVVDELKDSIAQINISITRIQTILELYLKDRGKQ